MYEQFHAGLKLNEEAEPFKFLWLLKYINRYTQKYLLYEIKKNYTKNIPKYKTEQMYMDT